MNELTQDPRLLALLETGHREAVDALAELKAGWARFDEEVARDRDFILASHAQGARDRDAMRVKLGGSSLIEAEAREKAEAQAALDAETQRLAAKRLAAADAEATRLADVARVAPVPADRVIEGTGSSLNPPAPGDHTADSGAVPTNDEGPGAVKVDPHEG